MIPRMALPVFRRGLAVLLLAPWLGCVPTSQSRPVSASTKRSAANAAARKLSQPAPTPTPPDGTRKPVPSAGDLKRDMVTAHNQARARASRPTPKPALPALVWSDEAARKAEAYAKECRFEHNPDRGTFGENLAAATPDTWTTAQVVKSWADESADYDYARGTCARGKMCGHYTQVVWRTTQAVGCATRLCTKNSPFGANVGTWQLWVCNYAPPGNWVGQKPY
ncbi:serine protease [Corallococcus sicarius]|uniref:Serine protease n=2 Tax=Corallococcus sicarius TaxID=2316726 RepID=A0A3A8NM84_9BACT|nr:serine protease [Corallococcus sicarius]